MTRIKKIFAVAGATALLAVSAPAVYAQSGTEGYGGSNVVPGLEQGGGGEAQTAPAEESAPVEATPVAAAPVEAAPVQAAADEGGSLPFTGADLGVLAAAGGILLALGFGLRRLTHRPSHQ
jgi:hypothetical protein